MIDLSQIEKLDIRWPVEVGSRGIIIGSDKRIVAIVSYASPEVFGEFIAATLNAFHNDPKRFNQLLNE